LSTPSDPHLTTAKEGGRKKGREEWGVRKEGWQEGRKAKRRNQENK